MSVGSIKSLDEGVLAGLTWLDVPKLDPSVLTSRG